jgi:hypothetical protein
MSSEKYGKVLIDNKSVLILNRQQRRMMNKLFRRLVFLLAIIAIIWLFRPFFHELLMSFVISPLSGILIILLVLGLWGMTRSVLHLKFVKISDTNYTLKAGQGFSAKSFSLLLIVIIVLGFLISMQNEIRLFIASKQVAFDNRSELPNFEPIRLTPKQVANRYATDSFQSPQEHLGDSQIVTINGKLQRVFPRLPDGWLLYFLKKMNGFVTVEVDTLDRQVAIEDAQFKYSEGVGVFDNLYYRLPLSKFFVTYSKEPIYLKNDKNEWVTVVPYLKYKNFPFTVPYWGGIMVVEQNGTITDYNPEQASSLSWVQNNRIFPKELTLYYANAYAYKDGLINKWFLHKDQSEVVSLPNDEPVLHISTNEGFKEMVVAEPYGRSYGIYKIFFVDATTGKREIISYDMQSQLTGPVVAADYIKREFPSYNWGSFILSEPRPVKINGDLNWMLTIIPNDAAGIAKTVLLDAKTNKVLSFDTGAQLTEILKTGAVPETVVLPNKTDVVDKAALKQQIDAIQQQLDNLKTLLK